MNLLGDASYTIYLSHPIILGDLNASLIPIVLNRIDINPNLLVVALSAIATIAGCCTYIIIEKPMLRVLKKKNFIKQSLIYPIAFYTPFFTHQLNDYSSMNLFNTNRQNKVVCIGRNYVAHAKELNNSVPSEPLLFMKPWTTIVPLEGDIEIPSHLGEVHNELEIAFVIGERLSRASEQQTEKAITGIGLALDLTLRDIQTQLKAQKQPWEKAKGFDGACPIECIDIDIKDLNLDKLLLTLKVNGKIKQQGTSADMIFKPLSLITYISQWFTLIPGDIVLTGTPAGVGVLQNNDILESTLIFNEKKLLNIRSRISSYP